MKIIEKILLAILLNNSTLFSLPAIAQIDNCPTVSITSPKITIQEREASLLTNPDINAEVAYVAGIGEEIELIDLIPKYSNNLCWYHVKAPAEVSQSELWLSVDPQSQIHPSPDTEPTISPTEEPYAAPTEEPAENPPPSPMLDISPSPTDNSFSQPPEKNKYPEPSPSPDLPTASDSNTVSDVNDNTNTAIILGSIGVSGR